MSQQQQAPVNDADPALIGYCAIVVTDEVAKSDFWQAYFLNVNLRQTGQELLVRARSLSSEEGAMSTVVEEQAGLGVADQPLLGVLAASMVSRGILDDRASVGALAMAISELTGERFFWIEATVQAERIATKMRDFPLTCRTIPLARNYINNLTQVQCMKDKISRNKLQRGKSH